MKFKIINFISFYLFYIKFVNSFFIQEELYDYQEKNSNNLESVILSSYSDNDFNNNINSKMKSCFEPEEKKEINLGEVQTELIYNEKIYIFYFDSFNHNTENDFLINFYPLDCDIKILKHEKKENGIDIYPISNYEYDSYYSIIKKENLNSTYFTIKTLVNSKNDYKKNRTFHLIINSFEYINNTNLIIKEKVPMFINFNNTIDKINLQYNLINKEIYIYPISISFFIKERVKFEITISNNEDESFKRIVAYTDRILIDTNYFPKNSSYINIYIEKIEKNKDAVMIVKVIEDFSTPLFFQKNILNIGFIPSNTSYQYYYMEIFKGEEGGIILNNKKYKGILISKIINKGEIYKCNIFNSSECYPKEDERNYSLSNIDYLKYDEYSQNLTLNKNQTNKCEDGCYILITYYSIYFSGKNNNNEIIGTDFTLLSILIEDENELKSQIVNFPLNEHIFGIIDSSSHNIHYYSIYIPEKTKDIEIELHFNNIKLYYAEGIKRFNFHKSKSFSEKNGHIKIKDLRGDHYFTFALTSIYPYGDSNYYFKIFQVNSTNNILIYPLDTNKENNCLTSKITGFKTYSCLFLLDNIYKDLYNDIIIYAYGKEKVNYTAWIEKDNESNIYSINIENLYENKKENQSYSFLKIFKEKYANSKYIIINIQSSYSEELTILTNFYDNLAFYPSFQIFSYQLIYLYPNDNYTFNFDYSFNNQYRISINNTYGNGRICFDENCTIDKYDPIISGKRILSYNVKKGTKKIDIRAEGSVVFKVKIDYGFSNGMLEELLFTNNYHTINTSFPKSYFLKDINKNGVDINFYFEFNKTKIYREDIIIQGNIASKDMLNSISNKTNKINFLLKERIDNRTNIGLIIFEKKMIQNDIYIKDFYYYIELNSVTIISDFLLEIYTNSKNSNYLPIPINKYISGSFKLKNGNQSQKYFINFISDTELIGEKFIIEFSTNCKNIELILSDKISEYKEAIKGREGIQKFFINKNNNEDYENYFEIKLNNNNNIKSSKNNNLENGNYILKLYPKENIEILKNILKLTHVKDEDELSDNKSGNTTYTFKVKNNYNYSIIENYEFTYILNIYEKQQIKQNELINTTATIESQSLYSNITFLKRPMEFISYYFNFLTYEVEYEISIFVIIQNIEKKENKYYYSYNYMIIPKKPEEEKDNLIIIIIIVITIIIIIAIILIIIMKYLNIMKKNKELEEKVRTISFSGNNSENENYEDGEDKRESHVDFI